MTGKSCQPSRVDHPRYSPFLHGKASYGSRADPPSQPAFSASGFGPIIGLRPYFRASALHRAPTPHFTASGPGSAFTASGFGPTFTALGFGPASGFGHPSGFGPIIGLQPRIGLRPYFRASALHRALTPHLLHRAPAPHLLYRAPIPHLLHRAPTLHRAPAPHLLHRALAIHRASALLLGFGPALGFGPTFGFWPSIGLRPRIYCIGLQPYIGLRPCIGLRPRFYYIGLRPHIGLWPHFWASAPHQVSVPLLGFGPASGLGPAFTAFGPRPSICCFWALAQHLLLSGFDTSHLLLSGSYEIQNRLGFKFIQVILQGASLILPLQRAKVTAPQTEHDPTLSRRRYQHDHASD
ncbi:hypothetical protein CRG98_008489 [Punica granatum]|uniref:Uncharacterized protein n=1 Tax=Punica granatum TaxID=22663 RepID=A0A2I0KRM6_PUNGR|nr:hypothetical protein CRG98_008489 [Punica granatum]